MTAGTSLHEHAIVFLDGYCSTVQGLLDWFEVDLGFTELLFIQIDLCVMGWLRFVGSLKFEVSTVKEPYKRDYILQKRPVILRSLHIVATPYVCFCSLLCN